MRRTDKLVDEIASREVEVTRLREHAAEQRKQCDLFIVKLAEYWKLRATTTSDPMFELKLLRDSQQLRENLAAFAVELRKLGIEAKEELWTMN